VGQGAGEDDVGGGASMAAGGKGGIHGTHIKEDFGQTVDYSMV